MGSRHPAGRGSAVGIGEANPGAVSRAVGAWRCWLSFRVPRALFSSLSWHSLSSSHRSWPDAAYDTSPRDLRDNWFPVTCLVLVAVGLTTGAVAFVAHAMTGMPWAAAIALGAIVAPPDAAAATAVLRQVNLPHRIVTILEGESLLNDASALLIYRMAVIAVSAGSLTFATAAPTFLLSVLGSVVAGYVLALGYMRL